MKFRVQANDLRNALSIATLVPPVAVTLQGTTGYLFEIKDGKCSIHSRDEYRRIKVDVPVSDVDQDGSFFYLADKIGSISYLDGWVDFETGVEGDRYWYKYASEEGASAERSTCSPDLLQTLDDEILKAGEGFKVSSALLREALNTTKGYVAKATDTRLEDQFKTIQMFDAAAKKEWAKGDGCMFATDHIRMVYFTCEAFKGKSLSVHVRHMSCLMSFLAKCEGSVVIKPGEGVTFLCDEAKGTVLGLGAHLKQHGKFSYYPLKTDGFVFSIQKNLLVRALKLVRAELGEGKDKVRVEYTHADRSLRIKSNEESGQARSNPVRVEPLVDEAKEFGASGISSDFSTNININHLIDLVEPVKGHNIELRAAVISKDSKEYVLFRTIERFYLDSSGKVVISEKDAEETFICEVTRFMPSKD